MRIIRRAASKTTALILASTALCTAVLDAQVRVWTNHNDNARTGANLSEKLLTPGTVNVNSFGKLFSHVVDGAIFAQPLYLPNVLIPGKGVHNVVYVATMNDSVYAFDADTSEMANAMPLWHVSFTNPVAGITAVPTDNPKIDGTLGILGTPVIDESTGTMYLVARTLENGQYVQRLHALDVTTGREKSGEPVVIAASVAGRGYDGAIGQVTFNAKMANQSSGLALANNSVYVTWASRGDYDPWHGWVMAFDARTLQLTGTFNTTPDGAQGGIWQSGQPPAIDAAGNLFVAVGNGDWDGVRNFAQSVLKLSPSLSLLDWFTPDNYAQLTLGDLDLGICGVLLIPNSNVSVNGSKTGDFYVLQQNSLGHEQVGNGQIPQLLRVAPGHIHGAPVYWNSPNRGPLIYVWGEEDALKAFHFNGTTVDPTPAMRSTIVASPGMPGGILSLSADGSTAGTGILWASLPLTGDALNNLVPGVLRAFDASDLTRELWHSAEAPSRDDPGYFAKFAPPTVANGKVYLASYSNQLTVYGLFSTSPDFRLSVSNNTNWITSNSSARFSVSVDYMNGLAGTTTFSVSGLPAGINGSFTPASTSAPATTTLTIVAGADPPAGRYDVTVTAENGALAHSKTVTLVVTPPGLIGPHVDQMVIADGAGTVTTASFSTSSADALLLALAASDGPVTGGQQLSITGAGLTWTLVNRANAENGTAEIWKATAAATLTNVSVTSTQLSGGQFHQSLVVMAFAGSTGTGATAVASGPNGPPTVSLNTTRRGSLVYGVGNDWDATKARMPGANQAIVHQWLDTARGNTYWMQGFVGPVAEAPASIVLNDLVPTADRWNFASVEVLPPGEPAPADTTPPNVMMTSPANGATVSGTAVAVSASASDNVVVAGVQFKLDGANLGAEVTASPFTVAWNTTLTANGTQTLTAIARDGAGNLATSAAVDVVVSNSAVPTPTFDAMAFADQGVATTTLTTGSFSTTTANQLLIAFLAADDLMAGNAVTAMSGAGLTWELVVRTNVQRGVSEIWRTFAAAPLSNVSVTATLAQASAASLAVVSIAGVDTSGTMGSGAIGAVSSANAASGAPAATLTTTRANSWVIGVGNDWDRGIARTMGAHQTIVHEYLAPVGDTFWVQRTAGPIPAAGTTVTIDDVAPTGDRYNLSICEILVKP